MASKTTNLGLDTAKLTALHIDIRLKTILIFVKVANLVKKNNTNHLVVPA
jgi:hypothetical protein